MPAPGSDSMRARPPTFAIRSRMLIRSPSRSAGTSDSVKPRPSSRTTTSTLDDGPPPRRETLRFTPLAPACCMLFTIACTVAE
nr:hypothetical protein [Leifsonia sp. CL147]